MLDQLGDLLDPRAGSILGLDGTLDEPQVFQGLGGEDERITLRGGQLPRLRLSEQPVTLLAEPLEFGRIAPVPLSLLSFADGLVIGLRVISYRVLCVALLA